MFNRDQTNKEETIPQQGAPNVLHQKKTMKTQAVQVNETNGDESQINSALNRPDHPRSVEEECLRKEPFFINHYYSHPVGQCCCQQHEMTVRKRETMVQSSITPTYKISENSQKPQQLSEVKACTSIIQPPTYDTRNEEDTKMLQGEIKSFIVEPQLQFAQAPVPNDILDDEIMNRILGFSPIYHLLTMQWTRSNLSSKMINRCHSSTNNIECTSNVWKEKL